MQITDEYNNYEYTKQVERIIYINDSLYTLSESLIKSIDINTMEQQAELELIE